jgi:hypothetical protein
MASTAATAALPGLAACGSHGHYGGGTAVYVPAPQPPAYYEYYYYPDVMVYYHIHTGFYHYYFNGAWRRTRQRPGFLHLDDRRRHMIVIRDEHPHARHAEHRRKYPPQPVPPGNAHGRNKGPVPTENRGAGYDPAKVQPPHSQGAGTGPAQPQRPAQNPGIGRGNAQPGTQPQLPPQSQGAGHGHGREAPHGVGQARKQSQPVMQPASQPQPQPAVQPRPQPPGKGSGNAKPSSTCNSGKGKGACK